MSYSRLGKRYWSVRIGRVMATRIFYDEEDEEYNINDDDLDEYEDDNEEEV